MKIKRNPPVKPTEDNKEYLHENVLFIQKNGDYEPETEFGSLEQSQIKLTEKEKIYGYEREMVDFFSSKEKVLSYKLQDLSFQYNSWSAGWNIMFTRIRSMEERIACYEEDLRKYNVENENISYN